jgi:hypothetical protein
MSDQTQAVQNDALPSENEDRLPELDGGEQITLQPEDDQGSDTGSQEQEQTQEKKTVPLAALHEERMRRKEAERQFREFQRQQQERDTLLNQRLEALNQRFNPQQEVPSLDQDPLMRFDQKIDTTQQTVQQLIQYVAQSEQQKQQQQNLARIQSSVNAQEQEFVKVNPDYEAAVDFFKQRKAAEYIALGMSREQATQKIAQDSWNIAMQAAQYGESAPEKIYELAQAFGYVPPAKKLSMAEQGMRASKPAGGGTTSNKISLDALANMSAAEFAEATKGDKWQKMFGG